MNRTDVVTKHTHINGSQYLTVSCDQSNLIYKKKKEKGKSLLGKLGV